MVECFVNGGENVFSELELLHFIEKSVIIKKSQ